MSPVTVCSFVSSVQKTTFESIWKLLSRTWISDSFILCVKMMTQSALPLFQNSGDKCKVIAKDCGGSHDSQPHWKPGIPFIYSFCIWKLSVRAGGLYSGLLSSTDLCYCVTRVSSMCPSALQPFLQHDVRGALPPTPQHLHHHPGHRPLHPHAQPLVLLLHVQVWPHVWPTIDVTSVRACH